MKQTPSRQDIGSTSTLIPIDQLITIPEGIAITPEQLRMADLSTIPQGTTLLLLIGSLKVLIRRKAAIDVRLFRQIRSVDPLALKYGVKTVARAMDHATGLVPIDEDKAKMLPTLTFSTWEMPDKIIWGFDVALGCTGEKLFDLVSASDRHVMEQTAKLLMTFSKTER